MSKSIFFELPMPSQIDNASENQDPYILFNKLYIQGRWQNTIPDMNDFTPGNFEQLPENDKKSFLVRQTQDDSYTPYSTEDIHADSRRVNNYRKSETFKLQNNE